jgi:hypothetical protein
MTVSTPISKETEPLSWREMYNNLYRQIPANMEEREMLKKFCRQYLDTIEGMFDTNPDLLSPEHKEEYISCAQFMEDNYGRLCNRIKEVKATL